MLTDPVEIKIISNARQKNIRNPDRSRTPFDRIFNDYLTIKPGGKYLDLGAGQFDFGELVRERGGEVVGVDSDPAVIELSAYKGFKSIYMDIKDLANYDLGRFDGIFNKFSFNAAWFNPEEHERFVKAHVDLLKPDGWAWFAPWNGNASKEAVDLQKDLFMKHGFQVEEITEEQSKYYGIHGNVTNNVIFTRNLI